MLDNKLEEYAKSDMYPYHMPGHKRRGFAFPNPYTIDITEITDFDNLHQPQGVIREMMDHMKTLYQCDECYLLVNGSTSGNLSSIFAACEEQEEILIARNSHKSVYNALYLRKLQAFYLEPEILDSGILGEVTVEEVETKLQHHPKAKALVITSPTYEGIMSDLSGIVEVAHQRGVAVIVDAAHGAHLGFAKMPESPVASGADAVIMSIHKTLPAFTQTAILCYQDQGYLSKSKLEEYLGIFQTSSPSYILLAGISKCITYLEQSQKEFIEYAARLERFYEAVKDLQHIRIIREKHMDPSKIVISTRSTQIAGSNCDEKMITPSNDSCKNSWRISLTGEQLFEKLRQEYHLEMEMASYDYVLAMTSVMDSQEGLNRLQEALIKIDEELEQETRQSQGKLQLSDAGQNENWNQINGLANWNRLYQPQTKVMEIYKAKQQPQEMIDLTDTANRVAGEMICLYPPGIPVIVPGEEITAENIRQLQEAKEQGLTITGLEASGLEVPEREAAGRIEDALELRIKVVKQ